MRKSPQPLKKTGSPLMTVSVIGITTKYLHCLCAMFVEKKICEKATYLTTGLLSVQRKSLSNILSFRPIHWQSCPRPAIQGRAKHSRLHFTVAICPYQDCSVTEIKEEREIAMAFLMPVSGFLHFQLCAKMCVFGVTLREILHCLNLMQILQSRA